MGFIIFVIVLVVVAILYVAAKYNSFVSAEQEIAGRYAASQGSLTKAINKLKTMGITTQKYVDAFQNALQTAIDGRYKDKTNLLAILESTAGLPADVFSKMQQVIDSEYDDFYSSQVVTQDAYRAYMTDLNSVQGKFVRIFVKFPTQDFLNKGYDKVIMNTEAKTAFETGIMDRIDPFAQ